MPKKGDVHVVSGRKGWRVEVEGRGRAASTHDRQGDAISAGRDLARKNASELLVHGRDGKIRQRKTYGSDPRSTPG